MAITDPMKLYLTEDFREALAGTLDKVSRRPFRGAMRCSNRGHCSSGGRTEIELVIKSFGVALPAGFESD